MDSRARALLCFDSLAALTVGVGSCLLHDRLSTLYRFPAPLVLLVSGANLGYGLYSGSLATRATRGGPVARRSVDRLVVGNLLWTGVCVALTIALRRSASAFGLAHLLLEGAFVAHLALREWQIVRPQT